MDKTHTPSTPSTPSEVDNKEGKQGGTVSYSQDDLDRVASKVRAEVTKKFDTEKNLLEEQFKKQLLQSIETTKKETERLASLSAEEKQKELDKQRQQELEEAKQGLLKEKQAIEIEKNRLLGVARLTELGLKVDVIDLFNTFEKDVMLNSIETFHKMITDEVSKQMKEKLQPNLPTDVNQKTVNESSNKKNYF